MFKTTLATLVLASSLLTGCADRTPQIIAVPQQQLEPSHPGQMTVTGTATIEVSPDCADLTLSLSTEAPRAGAASSGVEAKEAALVAALVKLGLEQSDIKLSYVTLNPLYDVNKDGVQLPHVRAYNADITLTVTTRHFEQIPQIMEAGGQAGATTVSSQFRRSDLAALKKKVREMALTAAKEKAQQTAAALDIKLGRVTSVAENAAGQIWTQPYLSNSLQREAAAAPGMSQPVALAGDLQPLTLEVTVGYELSKAT